ncbi:MAG: succinylglutamate-semialdehyde dehydrogenase [Proteobacteria bacterium]|nr:succinylglutamate-semialdehyde dehydrogenase [Pseudomonadota bacterium]
MSELKQQHYIGGQWIASRGSEFVSENPASGEPLWHGRAADSTTINAAVQAASAAFTDWCLLTFDERAAYVDRFVEQLSQRSETLASALHQETGKPLWECKTEIATMIGKAAISVSAYQQRTGTTESVNNAFHLQLTHRAIGVFAVLGPYNFPGHLPNGHIIPALLAGNTIVFKPSELTPLFGELTVQCWIDAGLPDGVLNLVQGGRETGELLSHHEALNGLLFTGSSKTGHAIHRAFGGRPDKLLALEMGGNNPLVVDEVRNLAAAVYTIIQSAFISAGQRCTCARRLILVRSELNESLLDRLVRATTHIKVGSDDACFIGPVISNLAAAQVLAFEQKLLAEGAVSLKALVRRQADRPFIEPGIIDVTQASEVPDEECFGPLLQVIWVESLQEAITVANNTRYGLAAGLLSDRKVAWEQFYSRIRAGIVNLNRPLTGASGAAPFGGVGASGNYRPGAFYAADYSAYPVASMLSDEVELPEQLAPGISL